MSNFRLFAIGWVVASISVMIAAWFGFGDQPGLIGMMKRTMLCLSCGVSFVAWLGDRSPSHD
jgi:hypothetical protein